MIESRAYAPNINNMHKIKQNSVPLLRISIAACTIVRALGCRPRLFWRKRFQWLVLRCRPDKHPIQWSVNQPTNQPTNQHCYSVVLLKFWYYFSCACTRTVFIHTVAVVGERPPLWSYVNHTKIRSLKTHENCWWLLTGHLPPVHTPSISYRLLCNLRSGWQLGVSCSV